jgi:YbbR domain-containing protein
MLRQHTGMQEFEGIPVRVLCNPGESRRMEVRPETVTVAVKGQQQRLEQMRNTDIFVYVNCTDLTESTGYELPVSVKLPPGLQFVKTDPATVNIQVED